MTPSSEPAQLSPDNPPKILIFGTGAIGTVYTLILHRAGASVTAVCRSNYAAASSLGLTIQSSFFGNDTFKPAAVARTVSEAVKQTSDGRPWDIVVVCAKSFPGSVPSTAELIRPAVTEGKTSIVLIQNGIAIEDEYTELYPTNPLLSCVVYLPATQVEPGVVVHKEVELLHVGTFPATAPLEHKDAASRFVDLIGKGGATAELHDDVQIERWKKLIVNASWNPICALTRCRDVEFWASSENEEPLEYVKNVMLEVMRTAQASGFTMIDEKKVDLQIGRAKARPFPGVEPSMLADVRAGRKMEVEAIVGNTVRIAKQKSVDVPLLNGLYMLVKALNGKMGSSS